MQAGVEEVLGVEVEEEVEVGEVEVIEEEGQLVQEVGVEWKYM